ncbi:MAG: ammonia channel protein, partial [Pelomonas sp.]|nr:ammonia channel protein [Roseateles sp.]
MIERRQLMLGGALAATLAATAWVASRPEDEAPAAVAAPTRRAAVAAAAHAASVPAAEARQPWADAPASQLAAW